MENIIDERYFWGEIKIAGIESAPLGTTQAIAINKKNNEFNKFIAKYQKKYLTEMFGSDLAAALPNELKELVYDEETLTSPIANYVYYFYQRANATQTTAAGEKKLTVVNTSVSSPASKMCLAWNEMVAENCKIHKDLYDIETLEYETPLSYLNDIYANVDFESNIFNAINMYNI